ncbi:MAG: hypothetical protein JW945_06950, partial [Methanomicrobia archaeon]|nr:hypothetical protein [Methanomicrobia archaeon]
MGKRIVERLICISIVVLFVMSTALAATTDMTATNLANDGPPLLDETYTILFEGSVTLEDDTFNWTDSANDTHVVNWMTPHGALEAASTADGFTY